MRVALSIVFRRAVLRAWVGEGYVIPGSGAVLQSQQDSVPGGGGNSVRTGGGHREGALGWNCEAHQQHRGPDDRGQNGAYRAAAEERGRRFPTLRRRGGAAATDGNRC